MKQVILVIMYLLLISGFTVKPNVKKPFPKMTYTKIYDISYRGPIRIRKKEPYTFNLIKKINNCINNYVDNIYAMASFPLSYNFITLLNISMNNKTLSDNFINK